MRQESPRVIRMPRPTWTPKTDDQRAALDAIDKAVAKAKQIRAKADEVKAKADAEADNVVVTAIEAARQLGVPVRAAVQRTAVSRATVYRLLGRDAQ